jgi:hypothetical protein
VNRCPRHLRHRNTCVALSANEGSSSFPGDASALTSPGILQSIVDPVVDFSIITEVGASVSGGVPSCSGVSISGGVAMTLFDVTSFEPETDNII